MNKKKNSTFSNIFFAVSWMFRIAPVYTVFNFILLIFGDVVTLVEHNFLPAYIISCVEDGLALSDVLGMLIPIASIVGFKLIIGLVNACFFTPKSAAKVNKAIHLKLYEKAVSMEISKYDNSEYYNDFVWAMQRAPEHIHQAFEALRAFVSNIVVSLIAGSYVIATDASALFVSAFILLTTFTLQKIINRLHIKREEELVPVTRKRDYVNRVFYLADYVKDIKSSTISEKLEHDYAESSEEMKRLVKKHSKKLSSISVARDSVNDLVYKGIYLTYLFYQTLVNKKYGLGPLMALYNSARWLSNNLRRAIMSFPTFQNHSLYIEKLRTFLETENEMPDNGTEEVSENGDIVLENVCFTYPGNDKPTINGLSMHIKKGEKIALVGFNGAGKSTLIKLILRLYDPDSGSIRFDNRELTDYKISDYRKRFGVLFQDFEIIATDVAHNINMNDTEFDKSKADEVLKKSAFWERFQTLPNGYETQLTKEFDDNGINLSGGEAQKVALARVLYADSGIIILDEPSAALDPIAEYQLNKTVTELAEDKTVIIISHRLSTTRFVDNIYMLENGNVIEHGTHDELLSQKGKYAEMFTLQASSYGQ